MGNIFVPFALLLALFVSAQGKNCASDLSIFVESVKVKNYVAAYEPWKRVYDSCPNLNYATYVYGYKIIEDKIEKTTGEEQKKYINMFIEAGKKGNQYFPEKITLARKNIETALIMEDYKMGTPEERFAILHEGFTKDRANFHDTKAIYLYFSILVDLHQAGKKDLQDVFDTYDAVTEKIEEEDKDMSRESYEIQVKKEQGTATPKEEKRFEILEQKMEIAETIQTSIDSKLGALADCTNLVPLYSKNFENKKNDEVWLARATNRMDEKNCTSDPLFVKLVEALHKLKPSSKSAYYIGVLKEKQNNIKEASRYYNEAIELEKDPYEKSKILIRVATTHKKRGQDQVAYAYAQKALNATPSYGEAYLFMAGLVADSANICGKSAFEKRAVYWKAAEIAKKAGVAKPALKTHAETLSANYNQRAPSKADIFEAGMAGKTISFDACWVGGSVSVPKL